MRYVLFAMGIALTLTSAGAFAAESKKEVIKACEGDIKKFCANVEPGGGRIKQCLKSHMMELSARCKQEIMFSAMDKK